MKETSFLPNHFLTTFLKTVINAFKLMVNFLWKKNWVIIKNLYWTFTASSESIHLTARSMIDWMVVHRFRRSEVAIWPIISWPQGCWTEEILKWFPYVFSTKKVKAKRFVWDSYILVTSINCGHHENIISSFQLLDFLFNLRGTPKKSSLQLTEKPN